MLKLDGYLVRVAGSASVDTNCIDQIVIFPQHFKLLLFGKENTRAFFAKMKMFFGDLSYSFCQRKMVVASHNFCKLLIITFCSFKFEKHLTIPSIISLFNLSLGFCVVSIARNLSYEWCLWTVNLYSSFISIIERLL